VRQPIEARHALLRTSSPKERTELPAVLVVQDDDRTDQAGPPAAASRLRAMAVPTGSCELLLALDNQRPILRWGLATGARHAQSRNEPAGAEMCQPVRADARSPHADSPSNWSSSLSGPTGMRSIAYGLASGSDKVAPRKRNPARYPALRNAAAARVW